MVATRTVPRSIRRRPVFDSVGELPFLRSGNADVRRFV
jgi:hypothetical protein